MELFCSGNFSKRKQWIMSFFLHVDRHPKKILKLSCGPFHFKSPPTNICFFKVNNSSSIKRCEICSNLEEHYMSSAFILVEVVDSGQEHSAAISYSHCVLYRYGCSPVNLLHIFRTPFLKNTSARLSLRFHKKWFEFLVWGTCPVRIKEHMPWQYLHHFYVSCHCLQC